MRLSSLSSTRRTVFPFAVMRVLAPAIWELSSPRPTGEPGVTDCTSGHNASANGDSWTVFHSRMLHFQALSVRYAAISLPQPREPLSHVVRGTREQASA